jgi:hypothetical protein
VRPQLGQLTYSVFTLRMREPCIYITFTQRDVTQSVLRLIKKMSEATAKATVKITKGWQPARQHPAPHSTNPRRETLYSLEPHLQQAEACGAQEVQVLTLSLTQAVNTALPNPNP